METYSINEVAKMFGVSRDLIFRELKSGALKSFRLGRRRIITADHIREFIAERESK